MPRVKRGVTAHRRHKKILKKAKGYYGARSRVFRVAKQAVTKAGQYAYRDRRQRQMCIRDSYQVKLRNLTRFLENGDKAKVTLRYRGREMAHQEIGMELLKRVEADLVELGSVEQFPKMEGRQLTMVLSLIHISEPTRPY